jgi:probable HAF family extracellular repeat protein
MTTYIIQALPGPPSKIQEVLKLTQEVFKLNGKGDVAGSAVVDQGLGTQGILWLGGAPVPLLPPDSLSILYSVNDAEDAVGCRNDTVRNEIPILVRGGVPTDLDGALGVGAWCTDINNSGVLCGSAWNRNAFVYDTFANKLTLIPLPATDIHDSFAVAINEAGHVVGINGVERNEVVPGSLNGRRAETPDARGFFYDGAMHDLGPVSFVEDINDKRQVVGSIYEVYGKAEAHGQRSVTADFLPKIWDVTNDPPVIKSIPLPTSDAFIGAHAVGINNQGVVVGTCWTAASRDVDPTAYVYSNGSSTDLNTLISAAGWRLYSAMDINDAGMILGMGSFNGQETPFLLTPVHGVIRVPELVATLIFGGVTVDGGGWVIIGGTPIPVGPWGPEGWSLLSSSKRDALIGMALDEVAKYITDAKVRELVGSAILEGVRTSVGQLSVGGSMQVQMAYRRPAVARLNKGKSPQALRRFGLA